MRLPLQCVVPLAPLPHLDNPAHPLWQDAETASISRRLRDLSGLSGYLGERTCPDQPIPPVSLVPFFVRKAPHAYVFFTRPVPVVPTMTTTCVRGEKACSMRGFPLVVRMTIPL